MGTCSCRERNPCREKKTTRRQHKASLHKASLHKIDMDAMSDLLQARAAQLSVQVLEGPLNNKSLPDFLERRVIEAMMFTVFSTILMVMVGDKGSIPTTSEAA